MKILIFALFLTGCYDASPMPEELDSDTQADTETDTGTCNRMCGDQCYTGGVCEYHQ